ncbi:MAG TPA: plasmid pRiA4b ORF-3 family protein [Aldersonia sp.]
MSRRRKTKKRTPKPSEPVLIDIAEPSCTCRECTGAAPDPAAVVDGLLRLATDLTLSTDPFDAEMLGSFILSVPGVAKDELEQGLVRSFIPAIEERGTAPALALLLALGSVADDEVTPETTAAADRLVASGIQPPRWAADLDEPPTSSGHQRVVPSHTGISLLVCEFHRGDRTHRMAMYVDETECGAAAEIGLLADPVDVVLDVIDEEVRGGGGELVIEDLDPAEFRWQAENALDTRVELEDDGCDAKYGGVVGYGGEDGPGYHTMAVLLRKRLESLPKSDKPPAPRVGLDLPTLDELMKLIAAESAVPQPSRHAKPPKLPVKRKKSDGRAPVFRIKVSLCGATAPIWRRLEVPADITLYDLHNVIQVAFGWDDSHLHVFETDYGEFGEANPQYSRRSEKPVTLEQVVAEEGSRIGYTYDFGDDWRHEIEFEKITEGTAPDDDMTHPRCTGGRRATPPEDSGGIWGYQNLVAILGDPCHPEHEDRLEWLGLDSADEFDPARFNAPAVNGVLARLR